MYYPYLLMIALVIFSVKFINKPNQQTLTFLWNAENQISLAEKRKQYFAEIPD